MKPNYIKMTYDIVFKKFFTDKPKLLKLILKHFLSIDSIQDIIIINPEIPELEEAKHKEKQLIEKNQEKSLTTEKNQEKSLTTTGNNQNAGENNENTGENNENTKEFSFLDSSLPAESRVGKRVFLDLRVNSLQGRTSM